MKSARSTAQLAALAITAGLLVGVTGAGTAYAADPVAGGLTASPADSLFPNQGNSGYDVSHYDLNFRVDVTIVSANNVASTTNLPNATATIDAVTTGAPLSSYSFDFQGTSTTLEAATLNVDSVTVNGAPATFSRIENTTVPNATTDVHKLIVTPDTPVSGAFTTVVRYSGQPVVHRDTDNSIEGWNNTVDGATFVNQPVGSMTLFPNNNTPRDKATYTWTVNAPTTVGTSNFAQAGGKPYQAGVVSNGELASRTPSDDGTRTVWVWDQRKPMASELTLFSIGRYDIYESEITLASGRTIPEWTFIDPALSAANQATTLSSRAQLKQMLDFFETKYGPYPGNSTGLVTDNTTGINYALETQDRSFFPNSASRGTTIHEVMHQWWGNAVQPTDWNDIWLNEGPATYAENQFPFEGAGSTTTGPEQTNYAAWNSSSGTSSTWTTPPAGMTLASQLFGGQVYNRGSWTLEALRTAIGAADFETLMRNYQTTYSGGQITGRRTAAFIAMAEQVSGRDLTAFFQSWLYGNTKAPWPVKFNLNVAGPTTQVNAGDAVSYTLSARNTGKVAMPAAGTTITLDAADILDDATIGALPANITQSGTTLTWSVPATALAATSSVTIPFTVDAETTGDTLRGVARAATLGGTCLDCTPSTVIGTAPISPAPVPTITGGTPTVAAPLTADTTGWAPGTTFTYQWFIGGTPVPGAINATYTPTGDVVGLAVTVTVTGTLAGFNPTSQTSAATAVGVRATQPAGGPPTISGTPKIGQRLAVDPGTWEPGTVFTYQWRANGTNISGATGPIYTPAVSSQVGQTIDAIVTGTKYGYTTTAKTSAATAAVAAGDPLTLTPTPVLTGSPKVGTSYIASPGTWDDGVILTYSWQANGNTIGGATAVAFTPTATQLGQTLTVTVTGTKAGIPAVSRVSDASAAVEPATQVLQPTPTIIGTPRAETRSTGVPGTWDSSTTRTYQWYADDTPIPSATAITYTPTLAQIGQVLTFEVTSVRAGYTTVVKSSAGKTIVGLAQTLRPTPTVTGTPQVAYTLTGEPGVWDDGTTLAYEWLADGTPIDDATGLTYDLTGAEFGKAISFRVTSTRTDYETTTATSDPTDLVAAGDLVATPVPTITGTPKVAVPLTAVPGTWDDDTDFTYQWFTDDIPVDGATGVTYTPGPNKVGTVITVEVTGTKPGYTPVTQTSDPTDEVVDGNLVDTPTPTITGTPKVAVPLTAVPGTWDDDTDLAYQWLTDGNPVDGATGVTYTPGPNKVGTVITVEVTGTKPGYTPVTRTSDPTSPVAAGDLVTTPAPSISGAPKVGLTLTATPGTWEGDTTLTYQWLADGVPVTGATGATFVPEAAELGKPITVTVTGTKPGYAPVARTSPATEGVAPGDLAGAVPTIDGGAKVGVLLTAIPGAWNDDTNLSYQWSADGAPVLGADESTFTPRVAEVGRTITVSVTGTKKGYTPLTKSSAATDAVVEGTLSAAPVPSLLSRPRVDQPVTVATGSWDAGVSLSYQWLLDGAPIAGATTSTYVPRAPARGHELSIVVTGAKPGYLAASRTSPGSDVAPGVQLRDPKPSIAGQPKLGRTLRVKPATYDPGVELSYTWFASGKVVGKDKRTLLMTRKLLGKRIWVRVRATKPGYLDQVRASTWTVKVVR